MNEDNENLNDLLKNFFDEARAWQAKRDIESGEQLLSDHPAPGPDGLVTDSIKSRISARLDAHKQRRFHTIARRMAVAAVIVVLVMTGIRFNGYRDRRPADVTGPDKTALKNIWQEDDAQDSAARDSQLNVLTAQIDEIADSILSIRLDEHRSQQSDAFIEIETELLDINGNFWKG